MTAILIKHAPPDIHAWLKQAATANRRSMTQQAIVCLEWCMANMEDRSAFPRPIRLAGRKLSLDEIDAAKKAGRP